MQVTRRLCLCDERCHARDDGRFLYSASYHGWIFTLGPRRTMTAKARYLGSSRPGFVDHSGDPVVFEVCPFCGGDLPMTAPHYGPSDGEGSE